MRYTALDRMSVAGGIRWQVDESFFTIQKLFSVRNSKNRKRWGCDVIPRETLYSFGGICGVFTKKVHQVLWPL